MTMTTRSSSSTYGGSQTSKVAKYESPKRFVGRLQATTTRLPEKPSVNFAKGGSDFRTPQSTSSLGKQILGSTACRVSIASAPRFEKSSTVGIGPNLAQVSSMKKQMISHRTSAPSVGFGTSVRGAELKQYSLYTSTRRWHVDVSLLPLSGENLDLLQYMIQERLLHTFVR